MDELTTAYSKSRWKKSLYSGSNGGNCVEVMSLPENGRAIRDSKNPRQVLVVGGTQWDLFVADIKQHRLR